MHTHTTASFDYTCTPNDTVAPERCFLSSFPSSPARVRIPNGSSGETVSLPVQIASSPWKAHHLFFPPKSHKYHGRKRIGLTLGRALQGTSRHTYVPGPLWNATHQNSALAVSKVGKEDTFGECGCWNFIACLQSSWCPMKDSAIRGFALDEKFLT